MSVAQSILRTSNRRLALVALVVLIVQHDAETLRFYHVGEALLVIAGILTIWSGFHYLRAAWPVLRGDTPYRPERDA